MILKRADVFLEWEDGRTVKLGTIDLEYEKDEAKLKYKNRIKLRQRIGWELVRAGFKVIFPFRTWKMET